MVGLYGYSMGGNVALDVLAIAPQRFRAAVIVAAGVGDIADMFAHWHPGSDSDNPDAQAERRRVAELFGDPTHNPGFWASVSPHTYAADITTPVQLHHGLRDTVVPARYSQQLAAVLTSKQRQVESFTYPGAGHVLTRGDQALLTQRSLEFYDQRLQAPR
jgi:dipeptidyl aminopeptidase/acylaminoacyl peptidase